MNDAPLIFYAVKDWDDHFENGESRRYKSLTWVPVKNKHDGKSYRRVSKLPNGVQVFCAWSLIIQVASKMPTRGMLRDEDGPITTADLADMTGFPESIFEMALKALSEPSIGWLIRVNLREHAGMPAAARQNPVTRQDETRREQTGKPPPGVMEKLRATLNKTYRRGESDAWSNIEETTLFDISKRPGAIEELEHILLFRSKMQPEDRRRFFPQALYALLGRWTENLDKARVQCPIKPKKPVEFPLKKAIAEKPISIEDLQSSLEWTRANTPNATEAIATLERRIKEMSKDL